MSIVPVAAAAALVTVRLTGAAARHTFQLILCAVIPSAADALPDDRGQGHIQRRCLRYFTISGIHLQPWLCRTV